MAPRTNQWLQERTWDRVRKAWRGTTLTVSLSLCLSLLPRPGFQLSPPPHPARVSTVTGRVHDSWLRSAPAIPSTVGRSVCLGWALSKPKGPKGREVLKDL